MAAKDKTEQGTATRAYDIYSEEQVDLEPEAPYNVWRHVGQSIGRNHKDALRQFDTEPGAVYLVVTASSSAKLTTKTRTTTTVSDA